ncbi:MAG TPA: sugar phosphate nucleotidyltransferase [Candidatus Margulisiibacteriota bacterium]|nr:sugar phosphate nucleotidyltransferase [Candidatus Margulisiibacteriota bacterium]
MNYAIILAGGIGSRFWPLSRENRPKQLLNLYSGKPMIDEAVRRIITLIPAERIYIATNKILSKEIKCRAESLSIPLENILFEPEGRNTFAPIAYLTKVIYDSDPEAVITVLPCDHLVKNKGLFLKLLKDAAVISELGLIVTLGAKPSRPETGYGYIKVKRGKDKSAKARFYEVDKFTEKPGLKKAKVFLKDKGYYWNCGIFVFRADCLLGEIREIIPSAYKTLMKISRTQLLKGWDELPANSIDYAIMEKTKKAALLPADFGWSDLGSWEAIEGILKKDKQGNIYRGNCISLGDKNSLVWSEKGVVASIGLENIIVVNTEDALLVCRKDLSQEVKKVVRILKSRRIGQRI